jgi:hypothetical protein
MPELTNVWKVPPVEMVPRIILYSWSIRECTVNHMQSRHFVGYNLAEREGRVSSLIVEFDLNARCGITRSGRVYELVGDPGKNLDAEYTFNVWQHMCGVTKILDVTEQMVNEDFNLDEVCRLSKESAPRGKLVTILDELELGNDCD